MWVMTEQSTEHEISDLRVAFLAPANNPEGNQRLDTKRR